MYIYIAIKNGEETLLQISMSKIQFDSTGKVLYYTAPSYEVMIQETSGNRMNEVADQTEYE